MRNSNYLKEYNSIFMEIRDITVNEENSKNQINSSIKNLEKLNEVMNKVEFSHICDMSDNRLKKQFKEHKKFIVSLNNTNYILESYNFTGNKRLNELLEKITTLSYKIDILLRKEYTKRGLSKKYKSNMPNEFAKASHRSLGVKLLK